MKRVYSPAALALVTFVFVACNGTPGVDGPKSVDYGPEVPVKQVEAAIANTYRDSDPTQTKVGAYVHFETNDDVGQGTLKVVTGDTAQTITKRTEDNKSVTFDVIENQVRYHQNDGTSSKVTRGYQLPLKKEVSATASDSGESQTSAWLRSFATVHVGSTLAFKATATATPTPAPSPAATPSDQVKITFHHLKTWEDSGPPPAAIQAQAGCLGIPGCKLNYRHVTFDLVFWSDSDGELTHIELTTSPQVPQVIGFEMSAVQPYIPGLMKSCLTQLISVNDGRATSKTLITECQQVDEFLYQSTPTP